MGYKQTASRHWAFVGEVYFQKKQVTNRLVPPTAFSETFHADPLDIESPEAQKCIALSAELAENLQKKARADSVPPTASPDTSSEKSASPRNSAETPKKTKPLTAYQEFSRSVMPVLRALGTDNSQVMKDTGSVILLSLFSR